MCNTKPTVPGPIETPRRKATVPLRLSSPRRKDPGGEIQDPVTDDSPPLWHVGRRDPSSTILLGDEIPGTSDETAGTCRPSDLPGRPWSLYDDPPNPPPLGHRPPQTPGSPPGVRMDPKKFGLESSLQHADLGLVHTRVPDLVRTRTYTHTHFHVDTPTLTRQG